MTASQKLFQRVGRRAYAAALAVNLRRGVIAAAAAGLLAVIAARLLGLLPDRALFCVLGGLAAAPLVFALAAARRPGPIAVARLIDERTASKDLFLTATLSREPAADFQPLVTERAEQRAGEISAASVVPFRWQLGMRDALVAILIVGASAAWLPQFDPFKKQLARARVAEREQHLLETKKATAARQAELVQQSADKREEVQQALARLEKTFKEAKPVARETTLKELATEQKELGDLWRKANNNGLRTALDEAAQSFGQADAKKLDEWRKELKQGSVDGLKKELRDIREQTRRLAGMPDSAERRAMQEQLAKRLNDAAQAMKQLANSPQLNEALRRALEQMDLSKLGDLSKDGAQAAMDSLDLSQQELDQLAQSLKDGQQLEQALKNLQMARALADRGQLDGAESKDLTGMDAYELLFSEKMGGLGESPGLSPESGMGPGRGSGAKRPEDDAAKTAFKPEKSNGQLSGGKLLLEWKTSEVGESGARSEQYRDAVRQVQQGVAEAIQQEQVPPGYHDTIKRYFDSLPK